jgi:hypothetical protein
MLAHLKFRKLLLRQIAGQSRDENSIVKLLQLLYASLSTILPNIILREEEVA